MNTRTSLASALLLFLVACSSNEREPDFRSVNWGMSQDQVKILENARLVIDSPRMLSYDGNAGGLPCQIAYLFVQDQLVASHYFFTTHHPDDATYIEDFRNIKETLTEKYGRPIVDEATWKNEEYRDDPRKVTLALKQGHVSFAAQWATPATDIWLFLVGENMRIKLSMRYTSKRLVHLTEETDGDSLSIAKPAPGDF